MSPEIRSHGGEEVVWHHLVREGRSCNLQTNGGSFRPIHPPAQEATPVRPWRNAERVSAEALAKADMLPAFVALSATTAE